ncbi:MAG: DUF192 domain-containing protein [Planctomycetota bacterium]
MSKIENTPAVRVRTLLLLPVLLLAAAASLVACQKVNPAPRVINSALPTRVPGSVQFDGGAQVRVQLLTTAEAREMAPGRTAFDVIDGVHHGLLHAYPADTSVAFRQHICAVDTVVLFLDGDTRVVNVALVPATPRKLIGEAMPSNLREQGVDPELWLSVEKQMTGAFAAAPLMNVRWGVQVPASWYAANQIKPGTKCDIPAEFVEKAANAEPVFPQIEFAYTPFTGRNNDSDRAAQRVKRFSLRTAFTPTSRAMYLSREGIMRLTPNDCVMIAWPDERVISLQTLDLTTPIFVVPFRLNESTGTITNINGPLVELRPATRTDDIEPEKLGWEKIFERRNWEYRSKDKHNGFLLMRGSAIYPLKLQPSGSIVGGFKDPFVCDLPVPVRRLPFLPGSVSVGVTVSPVGEAAVTARVRVLMTDQDRYRGLAHIGPLPAAGSGTIPHDGGEVPPTPVFDPTVDQADAAPEAWLLMFDRFRQRPLFSGGLKAPYDLIVFDKDERLSRVVTVNKEEDLAWPTFTEEQYRFLIVAPRGWLAHRSLAQPSGQPLPRIRLAVPSSVTRFQPEPERYEIRIGGRTAMVEVAYEPEYRNRGLMWRRTIQPDCGMLFVYPKAEPRGFWMLNCFVDMDIAYIASDYEVLNTLTMRHPLLPGETQPETGSPRPVSEKDLSAESGKHHASKAPAQFAIEMEAGWYKAHGIEPGAKVEAGPVVTQFIQRTKE